MNDKPIEVEVLAVLDRTYKDKKEEFRISLSEFNGKRFVSMRVFWQRNGEWMPGKQGCTVRAKELDTIINALTQARLVL